MMDYTGMLRPNGVPFSGFRYIKGYGISRVEVREKGEENRHLRILKGLTVEL